MAILNVQQPNGGNAVFNTVTDEFIEFNADIRQFSDDLDWECALRAAIGADMCISGGVQDAINIGLTSREYYDELLRELTSYF